MSSDSLDFENHRERTRDRATRVSRTRTQVKAGKSLPVGAKLGTVLTPAGPGWIVATSEEIGVDRGLEATLVACSVAGTVDAPTGRTLITVGDKVWFVPEHVVAGQSLHTGSIVRVEQRTTLLSRKAAGRAQKEQVLVANVEQIAIVIAAAQPDYHRRLVDRYLIAADKGDLLPLIVVNKIDLVGPELLAVIVDDMRVYADDLNLDVFFISTLTQSGLTELRTRLSGRSTLIAGQSGVGKTSIINALTDYQFKVGEISRQYSKGRHTTSAATVIPLPDGGCVVDSPGIREFALWQLDANELQYYFEEFAPFASNCRFTTCTHTHEPGCSVKQAVEDGLVEEGRYYSYAVLLEEITANK